jgi:hypothetical protein
MPQEGFNLARYDILDQRRSLPLVNFYVRLLASGLFMALLMETVRTPETSAYFNETT